MPKLIATGAVQADADVCNGLEPPKNGVPIGGGIHIVIPSDYAARIAAGEQIAGCTYHYVSPDGALMVSDLVVLKIAIPAEVAKLTTKQQTDAVALQTKLATAVVVTEGSAV